MLREAVHSQAILLLFSFCFALEPDGVSVSPVSSAGSRGSAVAMVSLWISDVLYLDFRLAFPGMASWATELAFIFWGHEIPKPRVKHRFGFIPWPWKPVLGK